LTARPPIAAAMLPVPMMLMVLMCSLLTDMGLIIHGLPARSGGRTQRAIHDRHNTCKKQVKFTCDMQAMLRSSHEDDV
jgi:hypothetical protein